MKKRTDEMEEFSQLRNKLIGLGEHSLRKSYYPELQRRVDDLERFKALLDQSNDLIFLAKVNGNVLLADCNETLCRRLGIPRERAVGLDLYQLLPAELIEPLLDELRAGSCEQQRLLVSQLQEASGAVFPVEISLRMVGNETEAYLVGVARDVSDRRKAEWALREANDRLEEKVELRTQELSAMNEELHAMNSELQDTLTYVKEMQAQMVRSEKLAALGGLVAGVAHEINTPVGLGVTLSSHLVELVKQLRSEMAQGTLRRRQMDEFLAECDEIGNMLQTNMNRAAQLVHSFKQVSVDQLSEARRSFRVKEYLEDILRSLHSRLKHTQLQVELKCAADLVADGYPGPFAQVVTNLLMNSLTHGYEENAAGQIVIEAWAAHGDLHLRYTDDGKGIAPEHLPYIFDPFFTLRRGSGSTGLGLHVLHNIVTQIFQGSVQCRSKLGKGVVFEMQFPLQLPNDESLKNEAAMQSE